jgi:hypothetical protein
MHGASLMKNVILDGLSHARFGRRELLVGAATLGACSSTSDETPAAADAKVPYPTWNATIANDYIRTLPDGTTARYVTKRVGDVTVGGHTYGRYAMTREGGTATTNAELWMNPTGDAKLTLVGAGYTSDTAKKLGLPAAGSAVLDAPLDVNLDAPRGAPQAFDVKATASVSSTTEKAVVSAVGSYTIVEKDISVQTPSGLVAGVNRVAVEGKVPLVFGVNAVSARGELWISKSLGVVKAVFDEPLAGFGMGVNGSRGWHDLGGGYASVEAVQVIGSSGPTRFSLSTTEASGGALDADKETHAQLLLEIRWVDEANAKTTARPYVQEELGTLLGYFPEQLVQSPVSFLHPEDNGKGYVFWIAFANEAAKNEPGSNGIAYHTAVGYDSNLSAIRVSSRIVYKRVL